MEKTLKLLEMGFSENEVSTVIEKFGEQIMLFASVYSSSNCLHIEITILLLQPF